MVPRKLIRTWVVVTVITWIGILGSYQYTNWVDRRSNGFWCGIVVLFDDTYKTSPPPTTTGQKLAAEFKTMRSNFHCK